MVLFYFCYTRMGLKLSLVCSWVVLFYFCYTRMGLKLSLVCSWVVLFYFCYTRMGLKLSLICSWVVLFYFCYTRMGLKLSLVCSWVVTLLFLLINTTSGYLYPFDVFFCVEFYFPVINKKSYKYCHHCVLTSHYKVKSTDQKTTNR